MKCNRKILATTATAAGLLLAGCGSSSTSTSGSSSISSASTAAAPTTVKPPDNSATTAAAPQPTVAGAKAATGELEIYSWWTSGSEHAALEKLFATVTGQNPAVKVVDAAVSGGAGSNAKQVLATRLSSGNTPATWQTHAGGAIAGYAKQDVTVDLTDLYASEGWAKVLPKSILESLTVEGKIRGVAVGVHRGNNLYFNNAVLAKAGVKLGDGTTWDEFATAAAKVKATGVAPLCLGDKDVWTDVTLLENIIIGEVGPDSWMKLLTGKMPWSDPKVATAVEHFKTALTWAQPDHQALDWTGAVAALADGKCAFNSMGDWEYGELLVKQQKADGADFGATILGDPSVFVTVTDVFVVGKGSKNEAGAMAWMKALMDPKAQLEFGKLKGTSPARNDVDMSTTGPAAQRNAAALAKGTLIPSLVQDAAAIPAAVSQAFSESVTLLVANGDAVAFAKAMDTAIAAG
jgi:glucose/mannose transport system substrate-binding protein